MPAARQPYHKVPRSIDPVLVLRLTFENEDLLHPAMDVLRNDGPRFGLYQDRRLLGHIVFVEHLHAHAGEGGLPGGSGDVDVMGKRVDSLRRGVTAGTVRHGSSSFFLVDNPSGSAAISPRVCGSAHSRLQSPACSKA